MVRAVRPYVSGDPAHLVHWPTSARTGGLVVRELEPPGRRRLVLLVDLTGLGADTEQVASLARGAAHRALEQGGEVVLLTAEGHGPVEGAVRSRDQVGRRLARAVPGPPPAPPARGPVLDLAAWWRGRTAWDPTPQGAAVAIPVAATRRRAAGDALRGGSRAGLGPPGPPPGRSPGWWRRWPVRPRSPWGRRGWRSPPTGPWVRPAGLVLGGLVGLLAVLGLRSLSVRLVPLAVALVSAGLLVRLAVVGDDVASAVGSLALWLLAVVAVLVLSHLVPEGEGRDLGAAPGASAGPRVQPAATAVGGRILAIWIVVVVLAVALLPLLLPRLGEPGCVGRCRPARRPPRRCRPLRRDRPPRHDEPAPSERPPGDDRAGRGADLLAAGDLRPMGRPVLDPRRRVRPAPGPGRERWTRRRRTWRLPAPTASPRPSG